MIEVKFLSLFSLLIRQSHIVVGPANSPLCQKYLNTFLALAERVGIPIKASKTCLPSTPAVVHGVTLDTIKMELSLPQDKCKVI